MVRWHDALHTTNFPASSNACILIGDGDVLCKTNDMTAVQQIVGKAIYYSSCMMLDLFLHHDHMHDHEFLFLFLVSPNIICVIAAISFLSISAFLVKIASPVLV